MTLSATLEMIDEGDVILDQGPFKTPACPDLMVRLNRNARAARALTRLIEPVLGL
jgi:hypothetical protein